MVISIPFSYHFIRMSVHLSCMSIDNRYCYFNSVVCFVYRFKRVLKNHNSIVLYVVELLINSSLHFFSHLSSLNI